MKRLLLTCILLCFSVGAAERPNFVLFISDDHAAQDCGAYGARDVRTPNIDRLARQGLLFHNAFAGSPTCMPSRAVMFTGLMPFRNGAHANNLQEQSRCRREVRSLPHYLQELGYRVALAGKTHFGPPVVFPFERIANSEVPEPGFETNRGLRLDLSTQAVEHWLGTLTNAQPFCLVVCDHSPHVIWPKPPEYEPAHVAVPPNHIDTPALRVSRARYYTDIAKMDTNLGQVLASLENRGLAENTLVIYTSDQGPQWPFAKWTLYDQGIRVPFIIRWPRRIGPGKTSDAMISLVDVLPTLIEIAGGKPSAELDGRSFLPVLQGKSDSHRDFIFATHSQDGAINITPMRCIRTMRYKYILNLAPKNKYTTHMDKAKDHDGGREYWDSWMEKAENDLLAAATLQRYHWRPRQELYDVMLDPYETHNLADDPAYAEIKKDLDERLAMWRKEQGDKKIGPDPAP
jgi:N-sulfoglucosamine sulfohydrolase